MEHREAKFSEKDKPAASAWSQNGGSEEEYECADGLDEEKRVKSVSWALKPAEEPLRLNFHIPRKSREKRALFQYVSTESREFTDILQILTSSYKDSSSTGMYVYSKPRLVHNDTLEKDFMEKRKELKLDGRMDKELSESFCFMLCDALKVPVVCERGLCVSSSWMNMLGNPSKGVYLCQFSDLLHINPMEAGATGNIIIFKVIKGKVKSVHDCMSRSMDPTPKFDSHFSKNSTRVTSLQSYKAFEYTQQYFYEYVDFEISSRPRHVRPYAVVSYQFKSREASTAATKPLAPLRCNSQPSGTTRGSIVTGRRSYTVWRGHFVNGGKDMYQACLRSLSQTFLPYKLPERIEIGKVMNLEQVKQNIPSALFSWNLYTGGHEVSKSSRYCSLFELVEEDKSPKSLTALLQKLEEEGLVLVNMVNDGGFLFLLSASQMANSSERRSIWKSSCIHALFIYPEKRNVLKSSCYRLEIYEPLSSEPCNPVMPQHAMFISALHYALSKARSDPPTDPSAAIEQQVYDYLINLREGKPSQRLRTDYDPKLDMKEKLFPAPRQKSNWESFMRLYIYNPTAFTMLLERVKQKVEELQVQNDPSTEQTDPHSDPKKVKELLKLIQLNKRNSKGTLFGAGSPNVVEDTCTLKRKVELGTPEGSSKRQRNKPFNEEIREAEGRSTASLANVLTSAGLQDTDLRKDKTAGALKVMEMLDSLGKTSLDTDLRKEKAQGALEVIKLIDNLTRGAAELSKNTQMKETPDISDAALFNSMVRLGFPTDRDIDLRKRFMEDEPERSDRLEEETAGSLSSLEAFSPCSDSGGQQRGVNLLGEKSIPWVLIPITGLKTVRYSQRQMDYPEDPRFIQSPTVSTHTSPDIKDLSPYQPDSSSNTAADPDLQTAAETEDDEPGPSSVTASTDCSENAATLSSGVDLIVDELISGFSNEVEELLRGKRIFYVSCSSTQCPQGPPQTPVPPLSNYISNFNTPIPVSNYISSFHESLMMFINSQNVKRDHMALEHVSSSSSAPEFSSNVLVSSNSNVCISSSSPSKPSISSDFLRPFSPTSALADPSSQAQHQSSLPLTDIPQIAQKMWALEHNTVTQETQEAHIKTLNVLHEVNDKSVVEKIDAMEDQTSNPEVMGEDISVEHTHSTISSIIDQLQPEVISNLVQIIRGVQKNTVYFYIHLLDEEESDVCWEIKEYLKKLGDLECNPHSFLDKNNSQDKLLVIIQNMDIAAQVHKIPALVSLKKHPSVSFAGVDNLDDIKNHTYNELFHCGGFIVSDEYFLNPDVITPEKLQDILQYLEQINTPHNPWRWRIHFKSHKKLREQSRSVCRLKSDALSLYEILTAYEKRHIVEILSYHDCDAPSHRAPDLGCLVDLQARFIKQRHLIFLTGCRFEMFPHYASSGIMIANVDDIKCIISSLTCENTDNIPLAEIHPTPAQTSLRQNNVPMNSSEDSSASRVSVQTEMTHVVTGQQPSLTTDLYPSVCEPSVQDQAITIPVSTATSEVERELDFRALSEAISQFKASRVLENTEAGEASQGSFRFDPHQSFLSHNDLSDSYPQFSENNSLSSTIPASETLVCCTSNQMQSVSDYKLNPDLESPARTTLTGDLMSCGSDYGNAKIAASTTSSVEATGDMHEVLQGVTASNVKTTTSTAVLITEDKNTCKILDNSEPWEHSTTISHSMETQSGAKDDGSKGDSGPATSESANTPQTAQANTSSTQPLVKDKRWRSGHRPGNSGYSMDRFSSVDQMALQGGSFMPTTHRSTCLSYPTFTSQIGAIGLRHPLMNSSVSNSLVGPSVFRGVLPKHNMQMAWNSLVQPASGFWNAQHGMDTQQIQRAQFIQNWHGNPAFQGNSYRPNRGTFGGW
ncbi:protein TASOR-like isoform X2 [Myxocyprinus asiaticus]|uniref:protein TASOR-like isoform X2 n=1 Tax=Myxocyprinus asiaticus TaxID=70543 RepID=UPI002222DF03|nr:protein TASOR-like isoform X2 [Myxocyprinus asiaticus]